MPAFSCRLIRLQTARIRECITDTFDYKDGRLRSAVGTDTEHLFHKLRTAVIVQV